jgi:hypothetical protein
MVVPIPVPTPVPFCTVCYDSHKKFSELKYRCPSDEIAEIILIFVCPPSVCHAAAVLCGCSAVRVAPLYQRQLTYDLKYDLGAERTRLWERDKIVMYAFLIGLVWASFHGNGADSSSSGGAPHLEPLKG